MKVVCICDAGVPEMLMQYMKKLPGCDVTLYTEKTLTDIKSLTTCERTAELRGAEACPVSAEMLEAVREAEILITHVAPVNRAVLDAAPNVKIVGVLRTGTENVDLDLCRERGIAVYNAEGRNSTAVADLVVALMLCEMRNIARAHGALVQGKWVKMFPNIMMNRDMCRCTVGIIGVGKIGSRASAAAFSAAIFSSPPRRLKCAAASRYQRKSCCGSPTSSPSTCATRPGRAPSSARTSLP